MDKQIWVINIVTSGLVIVVLGWLLQRFIGNYDKKIQCVEEKTSKIEKNYIARFEELSEKLDTNKDSISHEFQKMVDIKHTDEISHIKQMTRLETKQELITNMLREIKYDLNKKQI